MRPAARMYADLVHTELERLGWHKSEFEIFRCEVHYPMLHTTVHLQVDDPASA